MKRFVGLDVHKRVIEVCIVDQTGAIVLRRRFDLTRDSLIYFAEKYLSKKDVVVLEATSNTWAVVRLLQPLVGEVVVSNPLQTKAIAAAKVKTDKVDAYVLAQLLRCDFLPTVWIPDEKTQQLRRLTSHRASLVSDRTRIKNRIHSVLAQRLILVPRTKLFCKSGLSWLRSLELDEEGRHQIDSDLRLMDLLDKEISQHDELLAQKGYDEMPVRILMTLPGVDVAVALTIIAVIGDISRFRNADQAASYFGLVPSTRQSGSRCYHGSITKAGDGQGRKMLIQAAQQVRHHAGPLGLFLRKLAKKKNYNVAVTATARKLLVIAWHLLTKNEPYRYAKSEPTKYKLRRLRIKATGERWKRGVKPGTKRVPAAEGRHAPIEKPLADVYRDEGLPPLQPPPAGELRLLNRTKTTSPERASDTSTRSH